MASPPDPRPALTIVTAADSSHYQCMSNLLWTISKQEPGARVIALDLGLTADESALLNNVPPFYLANWQLRTFDFSKYPPHFNMAQNSGFIAFRPVAMADIAHEFGGIVIWMDGDCQLRQPLSRTLAIINKQGIYSPNIQMTVGTKLMPVAFTALGVTSDLLTKPIADPGICGFDASHPQIMALLDRWKAVTMDPNCTAPTGATLHTHNPDSIWSTILYQADKDNHWGLNFNRSGGIMKGCDNLSLAETKFRCRA